MGTQVAKIALVTINGKGYPADPEGTDLKLGGYNREAVAADLDPVSGFDETPVPSELTLKPIARADLDPLELQNLTKGEILIEYDNGAKYKMANAFATQPGEKGGGDGHWTFMFKGSPCTKAN